MLYLCVRPQAEASAAEYRSFLRGTGRTEATLHRLDLTRDALPADAFDTYAGFVVGGSPFNVSDPISAKTPEQLRIEADLESIARVAIDRRTQAFFTCYGIGVVTRLLGGEVTKDFPEEASAAEIRTTAAAVDDAISDGLPPRFRVLTAHKEGSGSVPTDAVLLATNDDCPAQFYRVGDNLYASQFHPEPTTSDFTWRMAVYRDAGYFDPADYDRLAGAIEAADVTAPEQLLRRFAERVAG